MSTYHEVSGAETDRQHATLIREMQAARALGTHYWTATLSFMIADPKDPHVILDEANLRQGPNIQCLFCGSEDFDSVRCNGLG